MQSGFVGGWIVLHLLQRGEDPRKIRVLDIRLPVRPDLTTGLATYVDFMTVDISDEKAVENAFKSPWPTRSDKDSPLQITVFHTAACIRFYERHPSLIPYSAAVNTDGTKNIINAARLVGASIMVFTSSASLAVKVSRSLLWPWEKEPTHFAQVIKEDIPKMRPHGDFTSNYSFTKACAEQLVREADRSPSGHGVLRTGCVRSANVYGPGGDLSFGFLLARRTNPSWMSNMAHSHIYVENCSIAHLLYEQRLIEISNAGGSAIDIGGQAFCVKDPGPPLTYGDAFLTLKTLTNGETSFPSVSPTILLLLAHMIELYYLTRHFLLASAPFIGSIIPPIPDELVKLQPAAFRVIEIHVIVDDSMARLPPEKGGLGYKGVCTTLEGLHLLVDASKKPSGKI